jgi:hypothetical protein
MARTAKMVAKHLDGILRHWHRDGHGEPQRGKLKPQGYRSTVCMITVLYWLGGKLKIPVSNTH